MHTREGQEGRKVSRRGCGSAGHLPWLSSLQLLRHPQGRLCLLVAMVPVGGCVTARQGQQADRRCGLKGPCLEPLWKAFIAPEGEVLVEASSLHTALCLPSRSPQGAGRLCPQRAQELMLAVYKLLVAKDQGQSIGIATKMAPPCALWLPEQRLLPLVGRE